MPRFNIALLPQEEKFQELFAQVARSHFAADYEGYLLGNNALAHVTLCQFNAGDEQMARDAFDSLSDKTGEEAEITGFHFREGRDEHSGFYWAELPIEKSQNLMARQKKCFDFLDAAGLEIFTPTVSYSPHITLARVRHNRPDIPLDATMLGLRVAMRVALGIATPIGVFTQEI